MSKDRDEKWVYRDKKLVAKVTTTTDSKGNKEVIRQKAHTGLFGGRHATKITSRTKSTK